MYKRFLAPALLLCLILAAAPAPAADGPKDTVQKRIDVVINILRDPQYKDGAKAQEQEDKLWEAVNSAFDFQGVARLAVGRNWQDFTQAEREKFSDLFAHLLSKTYLKKIRQGYTNEQVVLTGEDMVSDKKSVVTSLIKQKSGDIPVDYSLWLKDGEWKAYDVKVEGVSLVRNYRAQFNEILLNNPPSVLIEKVKEKLDQEK